MISIVMPFWKRAAILHTSLRRYGWLYRNLDIEIIVVDDGSPEPAVAPSPLPWPVRIIRLPSKPLAMNPCVPINVGVGASNGDVVVLTNPEIRHRMPILAQMRSTLVKLGGRAYLAAACWAPDEERWYCHSTVSMDERLPPSVGLHFCAMLPRALFDEVGGFSEEYRDGTAWEDADFALKVYRSGAICRIMDDLVVDHLKTPITNWPSGGQTRNQAIFEARWGRA